MLLAGIGAEDRVAAAGPFVPVLRDGTRGPLDALT